MEEAAKGILGSHESHSLSKGVDIVGDIAILRVPQLLESARFEIAEKLLARLANVRVVLRQTGPVESSFRTRRLEWLAGEKRTETLHREYGCQYRLDLNAVYFSPRLSHERKRIAGLVSKGECVVNFYAGVGSFSIMIAKHAEPSFVYSIDVSPIAAYYHVINNRLNRVSDVVDVICADSNCLVSAWRVNHADRVLLPLPELALDSLVTAKSVLRNNRGAIHCYVFVDARRRHDAARRALSEFTSSLGRIGATRENTRSHVVRSVGPCRYQVCLDIVL